MNFLLLNCKQVEFRSSLVAGSQLLFSVEVTLPLAADLFDCLLVMFT